jgi:hypothetical protein
MTDLLTQDPNDTGEIPTLVGETLRRIDTGEATQRIDPRLIKAPSFDAIPRKVFDLDDTVTYMPATIGIVDLEGPQNPPPPLPKPPRPAVPPKGALDDTERLSLLGSVAGLDGDLRAPLPRPATPIHLPKPKPKLRRSVPYVMPADRRPWSGPRHAKPAPLWTRVAVVVGGAMVAGSLLGLGLIAAVVR